MQKKMQGPRKTVPSSDSEVRLRSSIQYADLEILCLCNVNIVFQIDKNTGSEPTLVTSSNLYLFYKWFRCLKSTLTLWNESIDTE